MPISRATVLLPLMLLNQCDGEEKLTQTQQTEETRPINQRVDTSRGSLVKNSSPSISPEAKELNIDFDQLVLKLQPYLSGLRPDNQKRLHAIIDLLGKDQNYFKISYVSDLN
jgi:hypothetical protein